VSDERCVLPHTQSDFSNDAAGVLRGVERLPSTEYRLDVNRADRAREKEGPKAQSDDENDRDQLDT